MAVQNIEITGGETYTLAGSERANVTTDLTAGDTLINTDTALVTVNSTSAQFNYSGGTGKEVITADGNGDQITTGAHLGSSVTEDGGNANITLSGDSQRVVDNGSGNSDFTLSGNNDYAQLNAQGDQVTANGNHDTVEVTGNTEGMPGGVVTGQYDQLLADGNNPNQESSNFEIEDGALKAAHDLLAAVGNGNNGIVGNLTDDGTGEYNTLFDTGQSISGHLTGGSGEYERIVTDGLGANFNVIAGTGDHDLVVAGQATDTITVKDTADQTIRVFGDAAQTSTLDLGQLSTNLVSDHYNPLTGVSALKFVDGQIVDVANFQQVTFGDGVTQALQAAVAGSALAVTDSHEQIAQALAMHITAIEAAHATM